MSKAKDLLAICVEEVTDNQLADKNVKIEVTKNGVTVMDFGVGEQILMAPNGKAALMRNGKWAQELKQVKGKWYFGNKFAAGHSTKAFLAGKGQNEWITIPPIFQKAPAVPPAIIAMLDKLNTKKPANN